MMIYRQLQELSQQMDRLLECVRSGILADTTSEMSTFAGEARTLADQMIQALDNALSATDSEDPIDGSAERLYASATRAALDDAVNTGEMVDLGASAPEMRERLVDLKTNVDFAAAYLRVALGIGVE